ncbi:MAG: adenylate kinase [Verrucomicrobiota bacterium]
MNIVLLGFPGSGKGTQAKIISGKYSLLHISTGDIFREAISAKTPLGQEVSGYLSAGRLVPDKLVLEIIKARLATETRGLLFDGFPRTVDQAQGLDDFLASKAQSIDAVLFLDVDEEAVVTRLGSRRTCPKCQKIYNLLSSPPVKEGLCDSCGGKLLLREDDKSDVIRRRISVYKDQTEPLAAYYKGLGNFYPVKGGKDPEAVAAEIEAVLKNNVR